MTFSRKIFIFFCTTCCISVFSQTQKPEIGGYLSDMFAGMQMNMQGYDNLYWENVLHNRLNGGWQFAENWRIDAGMRNRYISGSKEMADNEVRFEFDRLFLTFEKSRLKLQIGRQRINWGQTFVWNPNDIFNTYSFFDFDYPERQGCDAFRATYFHSETASTEIATSINRNDKITAALMHRRNWQNIDFQIIGGILEESDIVVGGAFTGDVKGLNYRGEFSFFQQMKNNSTWKLPPPMTFVASFGLDYIFQNSLMLQAEFLYNSIDNKEISGGFMDFYSVPMSAKKLSICEYNLFTQASYPISSRLNGTLSGMYFIDIQGLYGGFSLDFSLLENLDLSLITQYFTSLPSSDLGDMSALLGFARVKYSF